MLNQLKSRVMKTKKEKIQGVVRCENYNFLISASSLRGLKNAASRACNKYPYLRGSKIAIYIDGKLSLINESDRCTGERGKSWKEC